MINLFLWIVFGGLSGWIGYLVSESSKGNSLSKYLIIGMIGGVSGGIFSKSIGFSESSAYIDANTLFSALIISAFCVAAFAIYLNFLGKTSSR